jgi:hypothetical protein
MDHDRSPAVSALMGAVGDAHGQLAVGVVAADVDLQRRLARAREVAKEAVLPVEAEVVGAGVVQTDRQLVAGPDRVAVGRTGDGFRPGLEVDAELAAVAHRELELARAGVEIDLEAIAEPA